MEDGTRRAARRPQRPRRRAPNGRSLTVDPALEAHFQFAPHGEAILDPELRYVRVNDNFASLAGIPAEAHQGKRPREVTPAFGALLESTLQKVVLAGSPVVGWETAVAGPGGTVHVLANVFALRDAAGAFSGLGMTVFDVSTLRAAEAARAAFLVREQAAHAAAEHANRMKDEFLARVSHELRTPLSSMLMWLHLLRVGGAQRRPAAIDALEQSAQAQLQVIDDLLDVARGLSGKLRIKREAFEPGSTVLAAVHALGPLAAARSVALHTSIGTELGSVLGDAGRIAQVVTKLVSNAIKFTPAGGRITVHLDRHESRLRLRVEDTGTGMDAEFVPRAFAAFSQAEPGPTRSHDGLGLGLAIVRQIVSLHEGTVHAESAGEGLGATFCVEIPARPLVLKLGGRRALRAPKAKLAGLSILVVEDDDLARDGLALVLEGRGARVATAASVREAVADLERSWPDLLVSDITMPGEDGYSLIHQVNALAAARGLRLPSLALTAHSAAEDEARALREGFGAHLCKPVELVRLLAVLLELSGRAP